MKTNFKTRVTEPEDGYWLFRALRSITEPARRHWCPECKEVYECHICALLDSHTAHAAPESLTLCDDCAVRLGVDTIFCQNEKEVWTEYDYRTGEKKAEYTNVKGLKGGRSNGLWRWHQQPIDITKLKQLGDRRGLKVGLKAGVKVPSEQPEQRTSHHTQHTIHPTHYTTHYTQRTAGIGGSKCTSDPLRGCGGRQAVAR